MGELHNKLNQTERELIALWKQQRVSNKECGRRLRRHSATIGRELIRNRFKKNILGEVVYEPLWNGN